VTEAATAVGNTVPTVGPAIGTGLTYRMLGSWGYSRSRATTAMLVSGVWNSLAKLGLPVLALVLLALQGNASPRRISAALAGIAGLVGAIAVFACCCAARSWPAGSGCGPAGSLPGRWGWSGGRPVAGWELATVKFRARTLALLHGRWVPITVATLVSHLSLYLVLLVSLREVGVSDAEVAWVQVLAVLRSLGWPPPSPSRLVASAWSRWC
jgi:putative heme transporter